MRVSAFLLVVLLSLLSLGPGDPAASVRVEVGGEEQEYEPYAAGAGSVVSVLIKYPSQTTQFHYHTYTVYDEDDNPIGADLYFRHSVDENGQNWCTMEVTWVATDTETSAYNAVQFSADGTNSTVTVTTY
jgi:hypothetical protein